MLQLGKATAKTFAKCIEGVSKQARNILLFPAGCWESNECHFGLADNKKDTMFVTVFCHPGKILVSVEGIQRISYDEKAP